MEIEWFWFIQGIFIGASFTALWNLWALKKLKKNRKAMQKLYEQRITKLRARLTFDDFDIVSRARSQTDIEEQ